MALAISLILAGLAGVAYGIVKKNRTVLTASIAALLIIAVLYGVYAYLYAQNPY